jgi:ABC-type sugar transport system permease subunit
MKVRRIEGPLLATPAMILIFFIMIFPLFYTVYCSLYNLDYMKFGNFLGLSNYIKIFKDAKFWPSLRVTFIISLVGVVVSLVIGTMLAVWVDKKQGLFGYIIQLTGLVPWVTSMVVAALLWKWVFDGEMGLLNYILSLLGIEPLNLFSTAPRAIGTTIFVIAWRTIGYSMVMILAGLKGISGDLIEAAQVDGANGWQVFWRVKLPMIKTPALISSVVLTMSNFNNNTIPMVLTSGGPANATNVITLNLYRVGFTYFQFGKACALAFVVFTINILLVVFYVKAVRYEV